MYKEFGSALGNAKAEAAEALVFLLILVLIKS